MRNIAIVDDDESIRQQLQSYLKKYTNDFGEDFVISEFSIPEALLTNYKANYDIVFMDIDMPGMNGLQAAKRLREIDEKVVLIFVTNLAQYAIKGYEVAATDFVVKPLEYPKFETKITRAIKLTEDRGATPSILLRVEDKMVSVKMEDIRFIEVQGHSVFYHTSKDTYRIRGSLKESAEALDNDDFFMCAKCYLVNLAYVEAVKGNIVTVAGQDISVSRPKKKAFMEALAAYHNKR